MPNTLTNLVCLQEKAYGAEREAFCRIDTEAGKLVPTTWGDFRRDVDHMACALEILGIEPADIVAIIANNCPEFLITDFACYRNRAVPVSIYATSSPEQIEYIIKDAEARILVVGSAAHYREARSIAANCPSLQKIIVIDSDVVLDDNDHNSLHFSDILELGAVASPACRAAVDLRTAEATPDLSLIHI